MFHPHEELVDHKGEGIGYVHALSKLSTSHKRKTVEADDIGREERVEAHRKRVQRELREMRKNAQHDKHDADLHGTDHLQLCRHLHASR